MFSNCFFFQVIFENYQIPGLFRLFLSKISNNSRLDGTLLIPKNWVFKYIFELHNNTGMPKVFEFFNCFMSFFKVF